jgi:hypothetical protein
MILHLKKMKRTLLLTTRQMAWSVYSRVAQMRISALSASSWFATALLVVL